MVNDEINKEIAEISRNKHVENLVREISDRTKTIELHQELLTRLAQEEKIVMRRYDIMLRPELFKIITPNWEYERDLEYVETLRLDVENKRRNDQHMIEQNREQINKVISVQTEALKSLQAEMDRLSKEKSGD